jgi:hypothetical protein
MLIFISCERRHRSYAAQISLDVFAIAQKTPGTEREWNFTGGKISSIFLSCFSWSRDCASSENTVRHLSSSEVLHFPWILLGGLKREGEKATMGKKLIKVAGGVRL